MRRNAHPESTTLEWLFERCQPIPFSGCWVWSKSLDRHGYAVVSARLDGRYRRTEGHLAAYEGTKRRIFHIVRTHERTIGNVKRPVKTHFRGERVFTWNGYQTRINVPGLHHTLLPDFNVGAVDGDDPDAQNGRMIDAAILDKAFGDEVHGMPAAEAYKPLLLSDEAHREREREREAAAAQPAAPP